MNYSSSYHQSRWIVEECWALREWQHLTRKYPWLSWEGVINDSEVRLLERECQKIDHEVASFSQLGNGVPFVLNDVKVSLESFLNQCLLENQLPIVFSRSHAVTRWSWQWLKNRRHLDRCLILLVDAHDDIGESGYISNRWLLPEWASQCILIGGWAEGIDREDLKRFLAVIDHVEQLWELPSSIMQDISRRDCVFVTVDLDFWPSPHEFPHFDEWKWGLSNYWLRELFIGHSRSLRQLIELKDPFLVKNMEHVADTFLEWQEKGIPFVEWRKKRYFELKRTILDDVRMLRRWIEDRSLAPCYVDVTEYCAVCDVNYLTRQLVLEMFNILS